MKKLFIILLLVLILCFMVGCQNKEAMAELEEYKAQAEVEEQNKEIVRRYSEEEGKGNFLEIIDEFAAPDVIYHYPNNNDISGLETIKLNYAQFHKAYPDMKHTGAFQVAEGDLVASRATWRGTHKGNWMGVEPTDKVITFTLIEVFQVKDGKIMEAWIEFDYLGWLQQLGMELKPKEK
ncbi:MAG: ester cyclase [Candidatus Aminicenantes bacterium]|nr:ester cyclase [Candidatus Aminicenantes bacterium]